MFVRFSCRPTSAHVVDISPPAVLFGPSDVDSYIITWPVGQLFRGAASPAVATRWLLCAVLRSAHAMPGRIGPRWEGAR